MHYYHLGQIPPKRHIQFRQPNGKLYSEELFSTEGFSNNYANIYHIHPPTRIVRIEPSYSVKPEVAIENNMQHRSLITFDVAPQSDFLESRIPLLFNNDVLVGSAAPQSSMTDYFFKNADADEVLFIHKGTGTLKTQFGQLNFKYGDYVVIPRGTIYQIHFDTPENRIFVVESYSPIETPKRYRNHFGQLLEHSPFCERDIVKPSNLESIDEEGEFLIKIKKNHEIFPYYYANHPFDVIGWDGFVFPYIFSIHDFEPITGRLHQPPPVHQTFDARNFVICSFVPRLFDYHPLSIPAPYNHSNVDSDEVLYYVDGDFMSRKNVVQGQITLHPKGIPHGPHPGTVEKSIGKLDTKELAVMVDTFHPLKLTKQAMGVEAPDYYKSWNE
jgi:homogentisate 1,2-dioxygenase